jgi:hypothetical protein
MLGADREIDSDCCAIDWERLQAANHTTITRRQQWGRVERSAGERLERFNVPTDAIYKFTSRESARRKLTKERKWKKIKGELLVSLTTMTKMKDCG